MPQERRRLACYVNDARGLNQHRRIRPSSIFYWQRNECLAEVTCLVLLLLVWLGVWIPRLKGPINLRSDTSTYYLLGTSLADGTRLQTLSEPGEISGTISAAPAGNRCNLSAANGHELITSGSDLPCGSLIFGLSGLFLLMAYGLARRFLSPLYALFVGMITALSFFAFLELSMYFTLKCPLR